MDPESNDSQLYEVHLITRAINQAELFGYITNVIAEQKDHNIINPRPSCAQSLYGDYPNQPMFTFRYYGLLPNLDLLVSQFVEEMEAKDIPIIRTKIEGLASHNKSISCNNINYFEFHFKVNISTTNDWNKLVNLLTPFGAHLFFNPYKRSIIPIVTIRTYKSLEELENRLENINKLLTENGFSLSDLEKEYSIFDSNVDLDKNWLFKDKHDNFIVTTTDNMFFK